MTILNSYVERVEPSGVATFLILISTMFAAIFLITSIQAFKDRNKKAGVILAVLCAVSLIILFKIVYNESEKPKVTTYEVILSDDYPASELLENYDLVEQRGEIWVIRDKKQDKEDQNGKGKD